MVAPNPVLSFGLYQLPREQNYVVRARNPDTGAIRAPTGLSGQQYSWGSNPPNTPNLSLIHISEPTRLRRIS